MPYYHTKDRGRIQFWRRKCTKCGKKWPWYTLFALRPPKDMAYYFEPPMPKIQKGKTSYAKWVDKYPGAPVLASRLPNWPRWARILSAVVFISLVIFGILKIRGLL